MLRTPSAVIAIILAAAASLGAPGAFAQQQDAAPAQGLPPSSYQADPPGQEAGQPPPEPVTAPIQIQPQPGPAAVPAQATIVAPPPTVVVETAGALPVWAAALMVLLGGLTAAFTGVGGALWMRRMENRCRLRSVAATLATELETRRTAFEAVPVPPNVDAGVSFVSSVTALARIEAGFHSVQGSIHLLPEKLAVNISIHYAAVHRVADFVKGQSMAAAVRMLQANRIGGHPSPDAGSMRESHVELAAAFRGMDKLIMALRGLA